MKEDSAGDKALKQFADLMIQKIKEVEHDWKKPWFSPEGGGGTSLQMIFYIRKRFAFIFLRDSGSHLLSHTVSSIVPSAA